jgi:undecaprenyl-diphosphatase
MDASLYRAVNRLATRTGWLHSPVVAYAKYGIALFAVALLIGWWVGRQRDSTADLASVGCTIVAVFVALGLAQVLGHLLDRARPYDVVTSVKVLVDRTNDFSFPSDHATVVGTVAGGLWFVDRRLGRAVAGFALLMAFARVYVGAHYPADVIAGLALGVATAVAVRPIATLVFVPLVERLRDTPLRPLLTLDRPR